VKNHPLARPAPGLRSWTRAEDYIETLARRRTARREREPELRERGDPARALSGTLLFLFMMGCLGVLVVAIAIAAWPGRQLEPAPHAQQKEPGTAPRGWMPG